MIRVEKGNITRYAGDAIVNAANKTLLGGGGVDGAIHMAAGFKLKDFCRTLKGCETGEAKISPGFDLPAKYVIHTVGPRYGRHEGREAELLADCYRSSLRLAEENGIRSIAFPSISTGAYNYPEEQAAEVAVHTCREWQAEHALPVEIVLYAFQDRSLRIIENALEAQL